MAWHDERTRRTLVTEAEGKRQASITPAEGGKTAAILRTKGMKQAAILKARRWPKCYALGASPRQMFKAARNVDANTMLLQYLDAIKTIGSSSSTKYIFPMEFAGLVKPFAEMMVAGGDRKRADS